MVDRRREIGLSVARGLKFKQASDMYIECHRVDDRVKRHVRVVEYEEFSRRSPPVEMLQPVACHPTSATMGLGIRRNSKFFFWGGDETG